jgi:hypothetical protein
LVSEKVHVFGAKIVSRITIMTALCKESESSSNQSLISDVSTDSPDFLKYAL